MRRLFFFKKKIIHLLLGYTANQTALFNTSLDYIIQKWFLLGSNWKV